MLKSARARENDGASAPGRLERAEEALRGGLDWLSARPLRGAVALVLMCLCFYLPGFTTMPPTDRDESRYVQATKQMLESGDFIDIRFQDQPRYKKPIAIYWLQSASVSLTGHDRAALWAYRIPSLFGAILAVLATWWAMRPLFGRQTALLGAALFGAGLTLSLEAHIAKSDGALIAAIALSQGALARIYLLRRAREDMVGIAAVFWIALGVGVLIKGPIAPAVAALTIATILILDRQRDWLSRLHAAWGLPLVLLIISPWFIAIGILSEGEFFRLALGEDFAAKLGSGQENHWGPPGYYFLLFWWTFWPAALIATGGCALWLWRNRHQRRALFLLAWIVPFWLVLEAVPTKLPHYVLPLYPAVAMAAAWVLREQVMSGSLPLRTYKQGAVLWMIVGLAQVGVFAAALWLFEVPPTAVSVFLAGLFALTVPLVVACAWRARFHAAIALALISAGALYAGVYSQILPRLEPVWVSEKIDRAAQALAECTSGPVMLSGYNEPSAVFRLGTLTEMARGAQAGEWFTSAPGRLAVVSDRQRSAFIEAASRQGQPTPAPAACFSGFNINGGRVLHIELFVSGPPDQTRRCEVPSAYRCGEGPEPRWVRLLGR